MPGGTPVTLVGPPRVPSRFWRIYTTISPCYCVETARPRSPLLYNQIYKFETLQKLGTVVSNSSQLCPTQYIIKVNWMDDIERIYWMNYILLQGCYRPIKLLVVRIISVHHMSISVVTRTCRRHQRYQNTHSIESKKV